MKDTSRLFDLKLRALRLVIGKQAHELLRSFFWEEHLAILIYLVVRLQKQDVLLQVAADTCCQFWEAALEDGRIRIHREIGNVLRFLGD